MQTFGKKHDAKHGDRPFAGARGKVFMEATEQIKTMEKGQNQPEQIPVPMAAQAPQPLATGLKAASKIWTPLSSATGDTETYRNWGINE